MESKETPACCEYCGKPLVERIIKIGQQKERRIKLLCECVIARYEKAQKESKVQDMLRILGDRGFQSGKYRQMTLDNFQPPGTEVVKAALDYIQAVDLTHPNWLYLYGNYGVGKTHIAIALTRRLSLERQWEPALVRWCEYCDQIQASFHDPRMKADGNHIRDAHIVVLDDIDKKAATEWMLGKLYDICDYRYIHNLPTIITANRSIVELAQFWDKTKQSEDLAKAIISRILGQLSKVLHFQGEDYRIIPEVSR